MIYKNICFNENGVISLNHGKSSFNRSSPYRCCFLEQASFLFLLGKRKAETKQWICVWRQQKATVTNCLRWQLFEFGSRAAHENAEAHSAIRQLVVVRRQSG